MQFAKIAEAENEEPIEIPIEPQGHILMSTLTAQFPGACGLKCKTEQTWRGVRVVEDKLYPLDDKWDTNIYIVTYPKDAKRKGDDLDINSAKSRKIERKCVDLIILGIPWKSTEDVVRTYFEQYGEVVLCEIKRDAQGNSKGFGFVRFKEYSSQCTALSKKHYIDGRWCDVKIPNSQEPETSRKIFVGRLAETITTKDLQEYFEQYGQVVDVYIPKPFRAFGFVTFVEADVAQNLCGESHIIKGVSVHVSKADPKEEERPMHGGGGSSSGGGGGGNMRRFGNSGYQNGSSHSLSSSSSSNMLNSNMPPSKYSRGGGGGGIGFSGGSSSSGGGGGGGSKMKYDDSYDNRSHETRLPVSLPPNTSNNPASGSHDQMNAMMNMFNPMMAAFLQQLASGMQPSQSSLDSHSNASGHVVPPWNNSNDYGRSSGSANTSGTGQSSTSMNTYTSSSSSSAQPTRFKSERY